jgi:hypothetical protein
VTPRVPGGVGPIGGNRGRAIGGRHVLAGVLRSHFDVLLTGAFFVACLWFTLVFHEMWRDELQAWMIARDSHDLPQLFHNLRYDGHPPLWYLLLFLLTRITSNPIWMQVLHVGIASVGIFLFARFAPFAKSHKVLYAFGYFPFFEYGVISRNYSLGIVCLFTFCVLVTRARKNYVMLGLTLFLLAETSAVALVLAPALGFYALVGYRQEQGSWLGGDPGRRRQVLVGGLVAAAGSTGALFQMLPPSDSSFRDAGSHSLTTTVATVWRALVPVPRRVLHFWGSNVVQPPSLMVGLSVVVLVVCALLLKARKEIVATAAIGTVSLWSFFFFGYRGSLRHFGFLYLLFVVCMWLLISKQERSGTTKTRGDWKAAILTILLLEQCVAAAIAVHADWARPFSWSKATASYVNGPSLRYLPIVVFGDYQASPVLGYADKQAYYLQSRRVGSFMVWNAAREQQISDEDILAQTLAYSRQNKVRVLLISSRPIRKVENNPHFKRIAIGIRERPIARGESYALYVVSP